MLIDACDPMVCPIPLFRQAAAGGIISRERANSVHILTPLPTIDSSFDVCFGTVSTAPMPPHVIAFFFWGGVSFGALF